MNPLPPPVMAIFVINGQVQVQGPLHDKVACYGLLEAAKDAIRAYKPPAVEVPAPGQARHILGHNGTHRG